MLQCNKRRPPFKSDSIRLQLPEVCTAIVMTKVRPPLHYRGPFQTHLKPPSVKSLSFQHFIFWQLRRHTLHFWRRGSHEHRQLGPFSLSLALCFPPSGDRSRRFTLRPSLRNRERRVQASTAVTGEPGDLCGICAALFYYFFFPLNIFQMQRLTSEAPAGRVKSLCGILQRFQSCFFFVCFF